MSKSRFSFESARDAIRDYNLHKRVTIPVRLVCNDTLHTTIGNAAREARIMAIRHPTLLHLLDELSNRTSL